jgi:predicted naringenin-chalcone synthase
VSKIVSIGTAVPSFRHEQQEIFEFMSRAYALPEEQKRKLRFVYKHSGISTRYSVVPDFTFSAKDWRFIPSGENLHPSPTIEKRMQLFRENAAPLSIKAINDCLQKFTGPKNITHLITVSCTGMSAPGLDLELLELLDLPRDTWRTSINFMGCYAAIHALKIADMICNTDQKASVLVVCVELCTLHFQSEYTPDNISSGILFGDGAAAVLITNDPAVEGLNLVHFYSAVSIRNKEDMTWDLSSTGFTLKLSSYIPDLIGEDFGVFVNNALQGTGWSKEQITDWCIHPGGKKILQAIHQSLNFQNGQLQKCYDVLNDYGNMSSPTVLFVLKRIWESFGGDKDHRIFGAAFGPGLTMETFMLST